jgi:ribosome-associated translation inhibitor RaiA
VSEGPETLNNSTEDDRAIVVETIDFLLALDGVTAEMRRQLERIKGRVENLRTR